MVATLRELSISPEEQQTRAADDRFIAHNLNPASLSGWAVIGVPSGSIAIDPEGTLMIKLRKEEADLIAAKLTRSR